MATPIGNLGDITLRALAILAGVEAVACEDTRVSGALLSRYGLRKELMACHDHNEEAVAAKILTRIEGGAAVALVSDAGLPLISDPGFRLVLACREAGVPVTVLPGACAAVTALAGAGLATDVFLFAGFLSAKSAARRKELERLRDVPGTLIFYEAPQRVAAMLGDCAQALGEQRPAAVARELTKLFEETLRGSLGELVRMYDECEVETRGEFVILVGAAPRDGAQESAVDLEALLGRALQSHSLRDAVDAVSAATGLRRSEVYQCALRISGKGER
ncbi:MAG: 16S rRNA (cytidine(1402)-2'-O)-methyltransferase [Bdellovibrionales bacterium]